MKEQEKSWYWYRNHSYDEAAKGAELAQKAGLTKLSGLWAIGARSKRVTSVTTRLYWGKKADRLAATFCLDGGEADIYFYFMIPWLIGLSVSLNCDWVWFKKKWPMLIETAGSKRWGFSFCRHYVSLDWNSYEDSMCCSNKRTGFRFIADWVDLIKGHCTKVTWDSCYLARIHYRTIKATYRPEYYKDKKSETNPDGSVTIPVTFEVRAKTGTWHYPRWWNLKQTRYEVSYDQVFIIPGKGENAWDCEDRELRSAWDAKTGFADYSCAAKSPDEAVELCIASIYKSMNRR